MINFILVLIVAIPTLTWAKDSPCKRINLDLIKKLNSISTIDTYWPSIDQKNMNIGILDNNRKQLYLFTNNPQSLKSKVPNSDVCSPYESVLVIDKVSKYITGKAKGHLEVDKFIDQDSTFYSDLNSFPISNDKLRKERYKSTKIDVVIDIALHEFFHLKTTGMAGEEEIENPLSNSKSKFAAINLPLEGTDGDCNKNKKFINILTEEFNDLRVVENILRNFKIQDYKEVIYKSCNLQTIDQNLDLGNKINELASPVIKIEQQKLLALAEKIWKRRNLNNDVGITACYNSIRMHERMEGTAVYFAANFNFFKDQMKLNPLDGSNPETFSNKHTSVNYLTGYILLKLVSALSKDLSWQQKIQDGSSLDSVLGDILKINH